MNLNQLYLGHKALFQMECQSDEDLGYRLAETRGKYLIEWRNENLIIKHHMEYSLTPRFIGKIIHEGSGKVTVKGFFKVSELGLALNAIWYALLIMLVMTWSMDIVQSPLGNYLLLLFPLSVLLHLYHRYLALRSIKKFKSNLKSLFS